MAINIFVGDEIYFKDVSIKKCIESMGDDTDILNIDLDEYKNFEQILSDMNSHLISYDFWGKTKVGILRTNNLSTATTSIEYFLEKDIDGSMLIIDVFNDDSKKISNFKNKATIKNLPKSIKIEYSMALKSYEESKLVPFVEEKLSEFDIHFSSKEDYHKSVDYIVRNSKLSYSSAYNEIKKLRYLNKSHFTYEKIVNMISDNLCTDRFYILDRVLESSNYNELLELLDLYLPKFKKKDLEDFITDISNFTKDYIVFHESGSCMQKSNYYKFKKLKFRIDKPREFLVNINKLLKEARKGNLTVADYLFLYIFEYFVF